jgi:hypothetical protein
MTPKDAQLHDPIDRLLIEEFGFTTEQLEEHKKTIQQRFVDQNSFPEVI